MTDRLMLLDTASLYFRAFYGVPDSVVGPDGRPINAARGLLDMIAKLVALYEPTHLIACWDDDWRPQWRVDLIPSYKAHRVAEEVLTAPDVEVVPDPLEHQIPAIREELRALRIPVVGVSHHEADDVIGTYATIATIPVDVVTGDRDLFQLIDDDRDVRVIYTGRGMSNLEVHTGDTTTAKYGIAPSQYADFAVLRGDPSDGLPGVAGIGEKTATTLLARYGDLAGIVEAASGDEGMSAGVRAKLLAAADYLAVAPQVVAVVRDLALPVGIDEARITRANDSAIASVADKWGLGASLTRATDALAARS
ncbi:5'-3' exonuclease [Microbacterium sp.]|uniref:5'-3' exonuclease n=1 Tax=Microbacterium sp. TaxID=51671 RepID=UPI0039E5EEA6